MLIVGLGNPDKKYYNTPHNLGFIALDAIAKNKGIEFKFSEQHNAMISEFCYDEDKIYLLKPWTGMNSSGNPVKSFVESYKISFDDILVIYDDMDLEPGKLRTRNSGSSGGHRGMKSIVENLGTSNLKRIKIGIGHPENKENVIDYVLHQLTDKEMELLLPSVEKIPEMVDEIIHRKEI